MSNINTQDLNTSPDTETESRRLRLDGLNDEQLAMLAATWDTVKESETPMADLRTAMSSSGLFHDLDKYRTNNLELRTLASSAHDTLELRHLDTGRADELRAILGAVGDKSTYADKRSALSDLLGFGVVHNMDNQDIDNFIRDAEAELASLESTADSDSANDDSSESTSNRDTVANTDPIRDDSTDTASVDGTRSAPSSGGTTTTSSPTTPPDATPSPDTPTVPSPATPDTAPTVPPVPASVDRAPISPDQPPAPDQQEPLVLGFVDQTYDAIKAARDAAEARRRNELAQGGRIKRFLRNMWKGENGLAGAYYLEKYKREELAKIEAAGDVMALESADLAARERAQLATIERMQVEYDKDAGEERKELAGDSEFALGAKDLLRRFVRGDIPDKEALNEEFGRLLEHLAAAGNQELIGEGRVRINNLFAIGEQIKAMDDHEAALDRLKIFTGESRSNVRSEAKLNKTEKVIERLQQSKYTAWISPETISAGAAVALGIARVGRGAVLRAAGVTLAPGVLGGAFAGMRESTRIKQERALHAREMAQGKRHENGERRNELDNALYEMVDATSLVAQLDSLLGEGSNPTPDEIQSAYEVIAMAEARKNVSNKRELDLIRYSEPVKIPEERRDMVIALAAAKVRLAQHVGDLPEGFRNRLNITAGQSADEALRGYTNAVTELDADIDNKDAAFRKIRRRRIGKAVATGVLTSALIGFGAQEALAFASPSYDGLAEHLVHGGSPSEHGRQTTLEGAREAIFGEGSTTHTDRIAPSTTYDVHAMGGNPNALELPSNYHVTTAANGTMTIDGPKGFTPIEGLTLDKNGSFTPESLAQLKEHNISVADTGGMVPGEDKLVPQNMSVEQYNILHSASTTHVTRDFPYDSNTTIPDNNEKRLWWAGEGDKGLGKDGTTIQMSVSHMTATGSFHGNNHVSWAQAAHEGKLKLAVSASRGTQTHVYFVDIKPNGAIDIPKDNPSSKFFSIAKDGQVEFNGAYAEVVEVRDKVGDVTHIAPLATEVGSDSLTKIPDTISMPTQHYVPHVKLTPPVILQETQGRTVEGFGGPSIVPRRPLERLVRQRRDGENPYAYAGGGYYNGRNERVITQAEYDAYAHDFSPRLHDSPDARLNLGEETNWYHDHVIARDGQDYADRLEQMVDSSSELKNLSPDIKIINTVPVRGASEADNIYKTLSMADKQDPEAKKKTLILLNVNWLDGMRDGGADAEAIQKTLDEIERARRDFPDVHIAVIANEYYRDKSESTGGVIGYVARDMVNAALFAIRRQINSGARSADDDVLILRTDADMRGQSRHFLRSYVNAEERNPDADVFKGVTRFDTEAAVKYPGFGVAVNIDMLLSVFAAQRGDIHTGGANWACRASTIAAVGGLGSGRYTGVASDDVAMGKRIVVARSRPASSGDGYGAHRVVDGSGPKIGTLVGGATIDTDADRFLPRYLSGRWWQSVWDDSAGGTSFSSGPGGYAARDSVNVNKKSEQFKRWSDEAINTLEHNIEQSLALAPGVDRTRVLSLVFKDTPGAYTLDTDAKGELQFKLTEAGRRYIVNWVNRDHKGRRRSFGVRQQEQLYGVNARGRSTGKITPLVRSS